MWPTAMTSTLMKASVALSLTLVSGLSPISSVSATPSAGDYENSAVTRTITLGGSISQVTTTYVVKALDNAPKEEYQLALGAIGEEEPIWWEVTVNGKAVKGKEWAVKGGAKDGSAPTLSIPLDKMSKDTSTTLTLAHTLIHHSHPYPASIAQDDPQYLLFEDQGVWVETLYPTKKETIKYRAPGKIISHSTPPSNFTRDQDFKKVGSSLTLGPYYNLPATLSDDFEQVPIAIHYPTEEPVVSVKEFNRTVDVAYWGGKIKVQDDIKLVNEGPTLKGQFSRLLYQTARFRPTYPPQILREINYPLPETSHDAWFVDTIGNVSTSNFRPSNPIRGGTASLELRPRYPVMGGWKYEFSVGFSMNLQRYMGVNGERHTVRVPFITGIKDTAADKVTVTIILPEGVKDVEVSTPFHVDSIEESIYRRHLDTIGRPQITIRKDGCTDRHDQPIEITFSYSTLAKFQKVWAVAALLLAALGLRLAFKGMDYGVRKLARQ